MKKAGDISKKLINKGNAGSSLTKSLHAPKLPGSAVNNLGSAVSRTLGSTGATSDIFKSVFGNTSLPSAFDSAKMSLPEALAKTQDFAAQQAEHVKDLERSVIEATADRIEAEARLSTAQSSMTLLEAEIDTLRRQVEDQRHETRIASADKLNVEQSLHDVEMRLTAQSRHVDDLTHKLQVEQDATRNALSMRNQAQFELDRAHELQTKLEHEIQSLSRRLHESELEAKKSLAEELEAKKALAFARRSIHNGQEEIQDLRQEIYNAKGALSVLESQLEEEKHTNLQLKSAQDTAEEQISALTHDLHTAEQAGDRREVDLSSARQDLRVQQQTILDLENRLSTLDQRVREEESTNSHLEHQVEATQKQLQTLRAELLDAQHDAAVNGNGVKLAEREVHTYKQAIIDLERNIASLSTRLSDEQTASTLLADHRDATLQELLNTRDHLTRQQQEILALTTAVKTKDQAMTQADIRQKGLRAAIDASNAASKVSKNRELGRATARKVADVAKQKIQARHMSMATDTLSKLMDELQDATIAAIDISYVFSEYQVSGSTNKSKEQERAKFFEAQKENNMHAADKIRTIVKKLEKIINDHGAVLRPRDLSRAEEAVKRGELAAEKSTQIAALAESKKNTHADRARRL